MLEGVVSYIENISSEREKTVARDVHSTYKRKSISKTFIASND